jgi:hypothetical protein
MTENSNDDSTSILVKNLRIVGKILQSIEQLLTLLKPVFGKVRLLEDKGLLPQNIDLNIAVQLLGEISEQSRVLESQGFSKEFLLSLLN